MADLITNLQSIYNTKLQIKEAIGTDSDVFSDYPSYITSLKPSGYAYITTNGDHNVNSYSYVNVNVPQGGAAVLGNLTVSENGQYSASSYSYDGFDVVNVNVPAVTPVLNSLSVYANGVYTPQTGVDGFNEVTVNVPSSESSHSGQSTADAWTIEDAYSYISAFEDTAEHMAADLGFEPVVEGVVASVLPNRDYSSQYPTARFWITRDGSAVAADYSNAILCWNMQSNLAGTWTEGIDMQIYPGQHVFIQCTKLQKYLDSNTGNYQMECKNGTAIVRQTSANGQLTISQSGTYDTTSYVSAYVNVSGGSELDIERDSLSGVKGRVICLSYQYTQTDTEMGMTTTFRYPVLGLWNTENDPNYVTYLLLNNGVVPKGSSYISAEIIPSNLTLNHQWDVWQSVTVLNSEHDIDVNRNEQTELFSANDLEMTSFVNTIGNGTINGKPATNMGRTKYYGVKVEGNDPYTDPAYAYIFGGKLFPNYADINFAYGASIQLTSNVEDPWIATGTDDGMGMSQTTYVKFANGISALISVSDGWKLYKNGTLYSDSWNLDAANSEYYIQINNTSGTQSSERQFDIRGTVSGNEYYYGGFYISWPSSATNVNINTGAGHFYKTQQVIDIPDWTGTFEFRINQDTLEFKCSFTPSA